MNVNKYQPINCIVLLVLIAALVLLVTPAAAKDTIAIRVNEETLSMQAYESLAKMLGYPNINIDQQSYSKKNKLKNRKYKLITKAAVINMILKSKAKQIGIRASEKEINQRVNDHINRFNNKNDYKEALKNQGLTKKRLRKHVAGKIMVEKLIQRKTSIDTTISSQRARRFYNRYEKRFAVPFPEAEKKIKTALAKKKRFETKKKLAREFGSEANIEINVQYGRF